jgi:hypothetical protein
MLIGNVPVDPDGVPPKYGLVYKSIHLKDRKHWNNRQVVVAWLVQYEGIIGIGYW